MRKISVVVPAYDSQETLGACLESLKAVDYPDFEVIVVDDGSTDGTWEIASNSGWRALRLARNRGAAGARNRGVKEAKGEIVAFTDADCIVSTDWLTRIEQALQGETAAVTGVYAPPKDSSPLARFVGHDIRFRFMRLDKNANLFGTYNAAVLSRVFAEVGGFDESIPGASWEDVDFGLRIEEAGCRLAIDKRNAVLHQHTERVLTFLRKQAGKACGQFLMRRKGKRSDYLDWPVAVQIPLTASFLVSVPMLPMLPWLGAPPILLLLIGLLNRRLLHEIGATEGFGVLMRSGWYILLRNGAWISGVLWALLLTVREVGKPSISSPAENTGRGLRKRAWMR